MLKKLLGTMALFTAFLSLPLVAAADDQGGYIKVEIKGTLQTGVAAIGGETTGTLIRARNVTWELDFTGHKELQEKAAKFDNKTVTVTGTYRQTAGVEIKERHIVTVTTLQPAD